MLRLLLLAFPLSVAACANGSESFDAEAWRSGDAETRGRMVRSLAESDTLTGLTAAEVGRLLGPPDGAEDAMSRETIAAFEPPVTGGAQAYYAVDEGHVTPYDEPVTGTLFVVFDRPGGVVDTAYVWYPMFE